MQRNLKWKLILILALMAICIYFFISPRPGERGLLSRINLGLDLKGGIHLVLQVVTDDAVNQDLNQDAQRIVQELQSKNITFDSAQKGNGYTIEIRGVDPAQAQDVRTYLDSSNFMRNKYTMRSMTIEGKTNYTLSMGASYLRDIGRSSGAVGSTHSRRYPCKICADEHRGGAHRESKD
jgi:preprotein translocase subunit SecD